MTLHNENPELDALWPITSDKIQKLSPGYFECGTSPACVAILPFIKHTDVGLELGVFRGASSTIFMKACSYMYFIDPCTNYPEFADRDWICVEQPFLNLLSPWKGRFTFIKGYSADVSDQIPQIDFAFIDGNHAYAYVKKDIELYWPKIKSGGFLSGHDYDGGHDEVKQAVDEFFGNLGLPVEQHKYCWLVKKP